MKYYLFFHLTTGRDVRHTIDSCDDANLEDESIQQRIADSITNDKFQHFYENGKLVIINMDNVASITVTKAE